MRRQTWRGEELLYNEKMFDDDESNRSLSTAANFELVNIPLQNSLKASMSARTPAQIKILRAPTSPLKGDVAHT